MNSGEQSRGRLSKKATKEMQAERCKKRGRARQRVSPRTRPTAGMCVARAVTMSGTRGAHWTKSGGLLKAQVAVLVQSDERGAGAHAGFEAACSSDSRAAGRGETVALARIPSRRVRWGAWWVSLAISPSGRFPLKAQAVRVVSAPYAEGTPSQESCSASPAPSGSCTQAPIVPISLRVAQLMGSLKAGFPLALV